MFERDNVDKIIENKFNNKYLWKDLSTFGNGKIINDLLNESNSVDKNSVMEFILIIENIIKLCSCVKNKFNNVQIDMENIG